MVRDQCQVEDHATPMDDATLVVRPALVAWVRRASAYNEYVTATVRQ